MSYAHRLEGARPISLKDFAARADAGLKRKEGEEETARLIAELVELQELLYAVQTHSVLVVLQGRDTSGKDGTIRHVAGPLNSQSCSVASFKVPTDAELAHDFLWRVHAQTPSLGEIKIFNRSHYEDVLVPRVHKQISDKVWRERCEDINAFERLLTRNGVTMVKFFLHISKDEQKERLEARLKDPSKLWKFNTGDLKERALWEQYQDAYEAVLNECSTDSAPWHVVPANRKWARNLAMLQTVVRTLEGMDPQYPPAAFDPKTIVID